MKLLQALLVQSFLIFTLFSTVSFGQTTSEIIGTFIVEGGTGVESNFSMFNGFAAVNNMGDGYLASGNRWGFLSDNNLKGFRAQNNSGEGVETRSNASNGLFAEANNGFGIYSRNNIGGSAYLDGHLVIKGIPTGSGHVLVLDPACDCVKISSTISTLISQDQTAESLFLTQQKSLMAKDGEISQLQSQLSSLQEDFKKLEQFVEDALLEHR